MNDEDTRLKEWYLMPWRNYGRRTRTICRGRCIMGRLLPLVFLVLVISCSETNETVEKWIVRKEPEELVPIHRLVEQGGITFEVGSNLPFTGKSIEYRDGAVYKRQEYVGGRLSGESSIFSKNGELATQGRFKGGKPDGEWNYLFNYEWYSWEDDELTNVRLLEQGNFNEGEPVGPWKTGFARVLNTEDGPRFEVEEVSIMWTHILQRRGERWFFRRS